MTNGAQSAGPTAAATALSGSISGSSPDLPLDVDSSDAIKEEDGEESEVDQVVKSIGVMKVDNNKAFFASEAHWYAILSDVSWMCLRAHDDVRLMACADIRGQELFCRA